MKNINNLYKYNEPSGKDNSFFWNDSKLEILYIHIFGSFYKVILRRI